MCRPDLNTWPDVKTALRDNYGDRTDRQTLMREFLQLSRNKNENILEFLERLKLFKSRVEVKIHTDIRLSAEQKTLLINQNELNALDVLAANSDNNLRLLLDIKPANNLASATDIVIRHYHNEQRIRTLSQNLTHHTQKPNEIHNRKPPVNRSQSNYLPTYKPVYPTHVSMAPRFNSYIPPNPNFYQRPAYHQQHVRPSIPKPQFPS
ncbi:hypothetical protein Trydic_g11173 [Trypoxylus dichotomus]